MQDVSEQPGGDGKVKMDLNLKELAGNPSDEAVGAAAVLLLIAAFASLLKLRPRVRHALHGALRVQERRDEHGRWQAESAELRGLGSFSKLSLLQPVGTAPHSLAVDIELGRLELRARRSQARAHCCHSNGVFTNRPTGQ